MDKDRIERWKSAVDLLRNALLTIALIVFILFPRLLAYEIEQAGITDWELFGLKGKTGLADIGAKLANAIQVNDRLLDKLETVVLNRRLAFDKLKSSGIAPPPLEPSDVEIEDTIKAAHTTSRVSSQALEAHAEAIQKAQVAAAPAGEKWVIVFGADVSAESALDEIRKAKAKGFNSAKVYHRQQLYLDTLEYSTRELAVRDLPMVRLWSKYSAQAYVQAQSALCVSPSRETDDIVKCGA